MRVDQGLSGYGRQELTEKRAAGQACDESAAGMGRSEVRDPGVQVGQGDACAKTADQQAQDDQGGLGGVGDARPADDHQQQSQGSGARMGCLPGLTGVEQPGNAARQGACAHDDPREEGREPQMAEVERQLRWRQIKHQHEEKHRSVPGQNRRPRDTGEGAAELLLRLVDGLGVGQAQRERDQQQRQQVGEKRSAPAEGREEARQRNEQRPAQAAERGLLRDEAAPVLALEEVGGEGLKGGHQARDPDAEDGAAQHQRGQGREVQATGAGQDIDEQGGDEDGFAADAVEKQADGWCGEGDRQAHDGEEQAGEQVGVGNVAEVVGDVGEGRGNGGGGHDREAAADEQGGAGAQGGHTRSFETPTVDKCAY